MRLLLTSDGLSNPTLVREFRDLVGGPLSDVSLAFVPTAAAYADEDKGWLLDHMAGFRDLRLRFFDIVELAALDSDVVRERLTRADVIVVGGGPAYKVKDWCDRHGVGEYLPDLLPERVYVGISAGSMLTNPHLAMSTSSSLWGELGEGEDPWRPGFGFVDFYVRPHLDHPDFPTSRESVVAQAAAKMPGTVYAVDNDSALVVTYAGVRTVGAGRVLTFPTMQLPTTAG